MFSWLRPRDPSKVTAQQLYGSSVAAARQPVLYQRHRVADTMDGRFQMVILHVFLLLQRLKADGEAGKGIGQALMEALFEGIDDDLRQLGVGDITVPKKMQQAAAAFFGRAKAYEEALGGGDPAELEAALQRNVPAIEGAALDAPGLAAYMRDMAGRLEKVATADLLAPGFGFPGT